jgi:hypothetical protein
MSHYHTDGSPTKSIILVVPITINIADDGRKFLIISRVWCTYRIQGSQFRRKLKFTNDPNYHTGQGIFFYLTDFRWIFYFFQET